MYQIDTADSVVAKPAYAGSGVAGWFQDTAPGGGTTVPQDWLNHVQAELKGTIEGLGGTLSKANDALLWTWLRPRVDGITAHATDTGSVSNGYNRVVIGALTSRASAQSAVVCGGATNHAGGVGSFIGGGGGSTVQSGATYGAILGGQNHSVVNDFGVCVGGDGNIADGTGAACVAGAGVIVSATPGVSLGGQNYELFTNNLIAWGWGGVAVSKTSANQNLTGFINPETGVVAVVDLNVGNPQAGTYKATIDGGTGDIHSDGGISADGDLSGAGLTVATGANKTSESYTESVIALAAGAHVTSTKANSRIGVNSIVLWSCSCGDPTAGEHIAMGNAVVSANQVTFTITNIGVGALTATWYISYVVINPD